MNGSTQPIESVRFGDRMAAVGVALVMAGLFWLFALAERMGAI